MNLTTKKWIIKEEIDPIPNEIYYELDIYHHFLRQILYNRGITTRESAENYISVAPHFERGYQLIKGIPESVDRIKWAIKRKEPIAIYGDYDVDGVTATALLTEALRAMGADVDYYIPNRFEEGYGLNVEALDELRDQGKRLIITVDCGIRSPQEAEHARDLGIDLIISDHHHPSDELPDALAIINPKQPGDNYPYKDLAGVGLAYKLAVALLDGYASNVEDSLDLVALGTIADLVPLVDENRTLVKAGLTRIREPHRQGLRSLIGVSRLTGPNIKARDIGFVLGPRLNAAGRLDTAYAALELLLAKDVQLSAMLAQELEIQNKERQKVTQQVQDHAEKTAIIDDHAPNLLFAADPEYNVGVIGLAASRLTEQYYRPAIVANMGEEFTRGSCRSIPEFHITNALDQCTDLMEHHGGHAAAAGFTTRTENLPELIQRLTSIADQELGELNLQPTLKADISIPLSELRPEMLEYLDWLEPTGIGNPRPKFVSRDLIVTTHKKVGVDGKHLKLTVTDRKITYDAIAFRQGFWADQMPSHIDILYSFEKNEFQNRDYLQLNVADIKASEG